MKKIFKLFAVALVAMAGLNSCSEDCDHDFIEHDFTKDIVGTWTYVAEDGLAEAMVIKADGTFTTTGIAKDGYLYEEKGTIKVVNNKVTLAFDGDKETFEGRLEFVAGKSMSLVMFDDNAVRLTYDYCKEDLSDEIIGMWVSNNGPTDMNNEIMIRTYGKDGILTTTGVRTIGGNQDWLLNEKLKYRVVGDLVFTELSKEIAGQLKVTHNAERFVYAPKATALGDIMNFFFYLPMGDNYVKSTVSFLRIKQSLELANKNYDYSNIYVTNVKGEDKEFEFFNTTLNFANLDNSVMDKFLKATLFSVNFPNANTISYKFLEGGQFTTLEAPIVVEENKMTIKMSANKNAYRDVVVYAFQDVDACQLHFYMPTDSFENFFANMLIQRLEESQDLDINDEVAVAEIHNNVKNAIQSINFSIVFKAAGE